VGLAAYATVDAALTFHDDLGVVRGLGVTILALEEVSTSPNLEIVELKDLDLVAIRRALDAFGVGHRFDAIAVAVLDHGFAPPGMSNRLFRFDHIRRVIAQKKELAAFAYLAQELPEYLTRMRAVAKSVDVDVPLLLLDTGVAAGLGTLQEEEVSQHNDLLTVNLGNSHTMALHLHGSSIQGLFEHHTQLINAASLDLLTTRLARGTLTNDEVYDSGGHGAVAIDGDQRRHFLAVTGPRQDVTSGSSLKAARQWGLFMRLYTGIPLQHQLASLHSTVYLPAAWMLQSLPDHCSLCIPGHGPAC